MKEFKKAKLIAKNIPTGSYAAGCGGFQTSGDFCIRCEKAS